MNVRLIDINNFIFESKEKRIYEFIRTCYNFTDIILNIFSPFDSRSKEEKRRKEEKNINKVKRHF